MAEAVDSSRAWKAARVLKRLALSWEGWEKQFQEAGDHPQREAWEAGLVLRALHSNLPTLPGERWWWWVASLLG